MEPSRQKCQWHRCLLVLFAVTYGMVMLSLDGRSITDLYSPTPFHRYQAMAFLHGHLSLADSMGALQPGLAWHDGHVEQVWGLGIGLWLVPFEAIWRLFGGAACPERIALGCAFALLAYYAGSTGLRMIREGPNSLGIGLLWLVLACPPLWTLARASQLVFEETVLYAVIVSLAILVSVVRVVVFQSKSDYLFCCVLGAFAGWVRPTHALYGLYALVICSWIVWLRRHSLREIATGVGIWVLSIGLLAYTNCVRFGSATEFGHHLTIATDNMVYLTRFGNPFHQASVSQAGKELFGLLFLAEPHGQSAFAEGLFPGQAPMIRWRRLDMTAFDSTWAVLCLVSLVLAAIRLFRQWKIDRGNFWRRADNVLVVAVFFLSVFSTAGLALFYLYYPPIASRYLFDFAPALTGLIAVLWIQIPEKRFGVLGPLLVVWLVYEISVAKAPVSSMPQRERLPVTVALPIVQGTPLRDFNGSYDIPHNPGETRISHNGQGWEPESGIAADILSLVVDQPRFIELRVSPRRELYGNVARKDMYQAQIDGARLSSRSIEKDGNGFKVVFDVPTSIMARHQDEMLFLCFSDGYDQEDRDSERFLYSVRWR